MFKMLFTGLQTGSGQMGFSQKGHKFLTFCHVLLLVRTFRHMLPHVAICLYILNTFSDEVNHWELWHFCDDPRVGVRSIRKHRVRKLRIIDYKLMGNSPWTWEFHPLKINNMIESNPLKSRFLVRGLTVNCLGLNRLLGSY